MPHGCGRVTRFYFESDDVIGRHLLLTFLFLVVQFFVLWVLSALLHVQMAAR